MPTRQPEGDYHRRQDLASRQIIQAGQEAAAEIQAAASDAVRGRRIDTVGAKEARRRVHDQVPGGQHHAAVADRAFRCTGAGMRRHVLAYFTVMSGRQGFHDGADEVHKSSLAKRYLRRYVQRIIFPIA
jgi:hypothetical protein